jgi:hypothetical protein
VVLAWPNSFITSFTGSLMPRRFSIFAQISSVTLGRVSVEAQRAAYDPEDEKKQPQDIFKDLKQKPLGVVRLNPDAFLNCRSSRRPSLAMPQDDESTLMHTPRSRGRLRTIACWPRARRRIREWALPRARDYITTDLNDDTERAISKPRVSSGPCIRFPYLH